MSAPVYEEREDLWGYAKRRRFVREAMRAAFPGRDIGSLSVLDVGCGNGSQLSLPLALREGFRLTGVDTDARSIEHARELAGASANVQFVCGEVEEISGIYDVVILSEVLEHMEKPQALLAKSAERMTRDGILIVTVPNGYGEFEIDWWIFRKLRLQKLVDAMARNKQQVLSATDNQESGHVQFFTRTQLKRLFAACGLVAFRESAGSFLAGPIAGHFLARSARLIEWNARVTDRFPLAFASAWYFALRRRTQQPLQTTGESR